MNYLEEVKHKLESGNINDETGTPVFHITSDENILSLQIL
jgi:hypothetical protein